MVFTKWVLLLHYQKVKKAQVEHYRLETSYIARSLTTTN
jgi:hypothetical protein